MRIRPTSIRRNTEPVKPQEEDEVVMMMVFTRENGRKKMRSAMEVRMGWTWQDTVIRAIRSSKTYR